MALGSGWGKPMEDVKGLALLVAGVAIIVLIWQRKRVLELSCTGIFLGSYVLFVLFGVLASPWLIDDLLPLVFSYVRWKEIGANDLATAICVVAGGLGLVLVGSVAMDMARTRVVGERHRPVDPRGRSGRVVCGYSKMRLYALCVASVGATVWLFRMQWQVFVEGVFSGYLAGRITELYAARESM